MYKNGFLYHKPLEEGVHFYNELSKFILNWFTKKTGGTENLWNLWKV